MSIKIAPDHLDRQAYVYVRPEQCRAARAWLDWTQQELARRAGVGLSTVRDFEKGERTPIPNNLAAIRRVIEEAGIRLVFRDDGEAAGIERSDPGKCP